MIRRNAVKRISIALLAAGLAACSDGSSFRTPTAPAPEPAGAVVSYTGSFTVLEAEPAGDCVADAFARDQDRTAALEFHLSQVAAGARGQFEVWGGWGCGLEVLDSSAGKLELAVDSWCGWENDAWSYRAACGSAAADTLMFSRFVLPAPGVGSDLQGTGQIVLDRSAAVSGPLPTVTLTVAFDLRR